MNFKLVSSVWIVLASLSLAFGDVVALKNGKSFVIPGAYEVKGQFVVFQNEDGQLVQLPLKAVDLEKSKELTDALKAEEAAKQKALEAPPPKPKKDVTMAEIAKFVEKNRDPELPPPDVTIGDDNLKKFSDENQRQVQGAVDFQPTSADTVMSPDNYKANREQFHQRFNALNKELEQLNQKIQEYEELLNAAETESAFSDEPTGAFYEQMVRYEKELETLRKEREAKTKELKEVRNQARRANVRDLGRGGDRDN